MSQSGGLSVYGDVLTQLSWKECDTSGQLKRSTLKYCVAGKRRSNVCSGSVCLLTVSNTEAGELGGWSDRSEVCIGNANLVASSCPWADEALFTWWALCIIDGFVFLIHSSLPLFPE